MPASCGFTNFHDCLWAYVRPVPRKLRPLAPGMAAGSRAAALLFTSGLVDGLTAHLSRVTGTLGCLVYFGDCVCACEFSGWACGRVVKAVGCKPISESCAGSNPAVLKSSLKLFSAN